MEESETLSKCWSWLMFLMSSTKPSYPAPLTIKVIQIPSQVSWQDPEVYLLAKQRLAPKLYILIQTKLWALGCLWYLWTLTELYNHHSEVYTSFFLVWMTSSSRLHCPIWMQIVGWPELTRKFNERNEP